MTRAPAPVTGVLPVEVRPVVLTRAGGGDGPAGRRSPDPLPPCLAVLGGSRLLDRLLGTLADVDLPSALVVTPEQDAAAVDRAVGRRARVLAAPGDRAARLAAAIGEVHEPWVLVLDAECALTPSAVVREVLATAREGVDGVVPTVAVTDSVKDVGPRGLRNVDRERLAGLQSPRLLRRDLLRTALDADGDREGGGGTDEVHACLAAGAHLVTVPGSHAGFAIVDRLDLWRAQIALGLARDTSHRPVLPARP